MEVNSENLESTFGLSHYALNKVVNKFVQSIFRETQGTLSSEHLKSPKWIPERSRVLQLANGYLQEL